MKKLFAILFLSAAAVTFTACGGGDKAAGGEGGKEDSGDKVTLRFKPAAGTKKTVDMQMNMSYMGIDMDMGMWATMTAKNLRENGDVEVETEYTRITVKMNVMGQNVDYDSDRDKDVSGDPMMAAYGMMAQMLNKPVGMVMNDKGGVVEAPDMTALLGDSLAAMADGGEKNTDQMGQMFDNMFAPFPENEVKTGDSWDKEAEIKSANGPMKVKAKYTVDKITENEVVLKVSGDLSGDMVAEGNSVSMSGTMDGSMTIDRKEGWTSSVDMTQDISMSLMGQNVNMKLGIKMTIK